MHSSGYPYLFIKEDTFHVSASGGYPVFAFKAPVGGQITLTAVTHGTDKVQMNVYVGDTLQKTVGLNTNGNTTQTFSVDVKKNTMVYLVFQTTDGSACQGWLFSYAAKYNTTNNEVETPQETKPTANTSTVYRPDSSAWGTQNNQNWYYMFLDKEDGIFKNLAYVRSENMFKGTADGNYEYLMITPYLLHPAKKGSPAMVFKAPSGGKIELSALAKLGSPDLSITGTGLAVYQKRCEGLANGWELL